MKKYKTLKPFLNVPAGSIGTQESNSIYTFRYDDSQCSVSSDMIEFLTEYFEEIEEQIDFSKFIWRWKKRLCIRWTGVLKSLDAWDIVYSKYSDSIYNDPISYTECKLSNLKYWDVFFVKWNDINKLTNYGIFIGIDSKWAYHFQLLSDFMWMEVIINNYYLYDKDVYKFNRLTNPKIIWTFLNHNMTREFDRNYLV